MAKVQCFFLFLLTSGLIYSQDSLPAVKPEIDANFIFSYYNQDGNHAAVTGGIGSEKLTDYATQFSVSVLVDSTQSFNADLAVNVYSSASTDRIDSCISSASSMDIRGVLQFEVVRALRKSDWKYSMAVGVSQESDYLSLMAGGGWYYQPKHLSYNFQVQAKAYFDRWVLYFPAELRDTFFSHITTDRRYSYQLQWSYEQAVDKRMVTAISAEAVRQSGLLSTPFHRVYFAGRNRPTIEKLPSVRWKLPVSVQLNYFALDWLILRTAYRYYWDNFGIRSHSVEVESPIKPLRNFSVIPLFRYYTQTASDYFQPFATHDADAVYYTPDYDLSSFSSIKYGLGIRYAPEVLWQIGKKKNSVEWNTATLRFFKYDRSDGLRAWGVTTFMGFRF